MLTRTKTHTRKKYREEHIDNDSDEEEGEEEIDQDGNRVIYLQRAQIRKIQRDSFIAVLGKRRMGKTTLMENLGEALQFPRAVALCGSTGSMEQFKKFIPASYVHKASVEVLQHILREREKQINENPERASELETLLYIDDMAFDRNFMFSKVMKELAQNGRWLRFCVVISIQYVMDMSTALRTNIDYLFVTREHSRTNRRKLFENWGGCCSTLVQFEQFLEACTQNFGCLVIDGTSPTTKFEKCFYHYRANPSLPPWLLGDDEFKKYHLHRTQVPRHSRLSNDLAMLKVC